MNSCSGSLAVILLALYLIASYLNTNQLVLFIQMVMAELNNDKTSSFITSIWDYWM